MKEKIVGLILVIVIGFFGLAGAALIDDQKATYLSDMRTLANMMNDVREYAKNMDQKWSSLALGSGGANEFIQADIDATVFSGLTVADLTATVTTAQAYETWFDAGHDDNMRKIMK